MGGLLDYFSREEGLKRREKLDSAIAEAARYYLGPTGLPERLGVIAEANPVQGVMRSMQAGRDVMSPTATPMERVGATGRMLSEVAAATAPSVAAYKGAIPAAQAVQEGLLGVSAGSKLAAKNFLADESGAIGLLGGGKSDPRDVRWNFKRVQKGIPISDSENNLLRGGVMTERKVRLPIRAMVATQEGVNDDFSTTLTSAGQRPLIIKKNNEFFVRDGHHRLTRMAESGESVADVDLIDFDPPSLGTPLLDYDPGAIRKQQKEDDELLRSLGLLD